MKRRTAALTVLAAGAIVGSAGAATFALWNNEVPSAATGTVGYVDFAVSSPSNANRIAIATAGEQLALELRNTDANNPLTALSATAPQYVPIEVNGQAQGNLGLAYSMTGVNVSGSDASLVNASRVDIREISALADCGAGAFTGTNPTLYSGALASAELPRRELVSSAYSTATFENPEKDFFCLKLTATGTDGEYTNTATVTGTVETKLGKSVELTEDTRWSTRIGFSAEARAAIVSFEFDHETFRGEFR